MNKKIYKVTIFSAVFTTLLCGCSLSKEENIIEDNAVTEKSIEDENIVEDNVIFDEEVVEENIVEDNVNEEVSLDTISEEDTLKIEDYSDRVYEELINLGEYTDESVNYVVNKHFLDFIGYTGGEVDSSNLEESILYWNEVLCNVKDKVSESEIASDVKSFIPDDMGEYFKSGDAWDDYVLAIEGINLKIEEWTPGVVDSVNDGMDYIGDKYDEYAPGIKEGASEYLDSAKTYIKDLGNKEDNSN